MSSTPRHRTRPEPQKTLPESNGAQVDRDSTEKSRAEANTEKPKDSSRDEGLTPPRGDDPTDQVIPGSVDSDSTGALNEAAPCHESDGLANPPQLTSNPAVQKGRKGFAPGVSGNPNGRPKGSKNKATQRSKALFDAAAEDIAEVAIEMAKERNLGAVKYCLDRTHPRPRPTPDGFEMPPIQTIDDIQTALACLTDALARGDTDTETASQLIKLIQLHRESFESSELAAELAELRKEVDALK